MDIIAAASLRFRVVGNGRYRHTIEHDSLVLDTYTNKWYWNSRGIGGTVEDFLVKIVGLDKLAAHSMGDPPIYFEVPDKVIVNNSLHLYYYNYGKGKRSWWYKRGLNDATIDKFLLGFTGEYYSLPFIVDNVLQAIQLRNPDVKFIDEIEGSKSSLFGYDLINRNNTTVFFTESPMDALILSQAGFNAISHNYGANHWNNAWIPMLLDFDLVIIPDNDPAGANSINRFALPAQVAIWPKQLPPHFDVNKLYLANPTKFINNINYLLTTAVPIEAWKARFGHNEETLRDLRKSNH